MHKTSTHGENSSYLSTHAILRYREGKFSMTIERKKDQAIYSVSDGHQSLSVPIKWAFGVGAGQTISSNTRKPITRVGSASTEISMVSDSHWGTILNR